MGNVGSDTFEEQYAKLDAARRFKKVENATALIWKVLMVTEKRFRKLNAPHLLSAVYEGIKYQDDIRLSNEDRRAAA